MVLTLKDALGILIAALGGAAVGLEREWSGHATGPSARFAGIRTFSLLGLLAGLAGWLWANGLQILAAVLLAGAAGIVAAYIAASRVEVDGTTEVAAFVVLAAGVVAGMHELRLASATVAITTLLLVEKSKLHSLAERIDDASLRAGFRFAVMAVVILRMLPLGPFGPLGGIRPRQLWAMVLFFSALGFAGYIPPSSRTAPRLSSRGHVGRDNFVDECNAFVCTREQESSSLGGAFSDVKRGWPRMKYLRPVHQIPCSLRRLFRWRSYFRLCCLLSDGRRTHGEKPASSHPQGFSA